MNNSDVPSVGDLAYVYKPQPCCGATDLLNRYTKVERIERVTSLCNCCGKYTENSLVSIFNTGNKEYGYLLETLKKIPPEKELESMEDPHDITREKVLERIT